MDYEILRSGWHCAAAAKISAWDCRRAKGAGVYVGVKQSGSSIEYDDQDPTIRRTDENEPGAEELRAT